MITVTLYQKDNCPDCEQVRQELEELKNEIPHQLVMLNIKDNKKFFEKYQNSVPVVEVGPYVIKGVSSGQKLRATLGAAYDRDEQLKKIGDKKYQKRIERGKNLTGTDRFTLWFSKYYMLVINFILLLYVGLPFLAPVFMKMNMEPAAKIIYAIYRPLCHQLGFRSVFLFGEQSYYPRELAQIDGYLTYEEISGEQPIDVLEARKFVGDDVLGYKIAICERCIAIYGAMLFFGLIFAIFRKKIKSLHWLIWIIVGLIPIGLDGLSQLPSFAAEILPVWIPVRESIPLFRYLTGGLFGLTTAWYLFPMIEEAMQESYQIISKKALVIQQTSTAAEGK